MPDRPFLIPAFFAAILLWFAGSGSVHAAAPAPVSATSEPRPVYAIVGEAAVRSASSQLAAFAAHKDERGFDVRFYNETQTGTVGLVGDAAAEALRAWLQGLGAQAPDYLLIIGDPRVTSGPFPMKQTWPRTPGSVGYNPIGAANCGFTQISVPTDYYYAELDGDWDLNGNGLYGEFGEHDATTSTPGDFGPGGVERDHEIVVGRIPFYGDSSNPTTFATHIATLDQILAKTIAYQSALLAEIDWRRSVLVAAEGGNRLHYGEAIRDDLLLPNDLASYRVYDSATCVAAGNCNPPLVDLPDADTCSIPNVQAGWGSFQPGVVTWLTHGGGWGAVAVMNSSTAASLDDTHPAITFQASCLNSLPTNTNNVSYAMLKNGAVATVGATAISHGPGSTVDLTSDAHRAGNAGMGYGFTERVAVDGLSVGEALMNVKRDVPLYGRCWYWQNMLTFNLYGDPEVGLYSHRWPDLDSFLHYKSRPMPGSQRPPKFGPLVLSDALQSEVAFGVWPPSGHALPADESGEGIGEPSIHLVSMKVKQRGASFGGVRGVGVTNGCSEMMLDVKKPVSLLAVATADDAAMPDPPDAELHNVDHFLCYKARATRKDADGNKLPKFPRGIQAEVNDASGVRRYDLKKPTRLCLPVTTATDAQEPPAVIGGSDGGSAHDVTLATAANDEALVCYLAKLAKKEIPQDGCGCDTAADPGCGGTPIAQSLPAPAGAEVHATTGAASLLRIKPRELCLPSSVALP